MQKERTKEKAVWCSAKLGVINNIRVPAQFQFFKHQAGHYDGNKAQVLMPCLQ